MELSERIIATYPELADNGFAAFTKQIILQDDSDGQGAYIAKWEYDQPIPDGLTLGKPSV
jgi:hypothetical protein